jgi:hypothetical protein
MLSRNPTAARRTCGRRAESSTARGRLSADRRGRATGHAPRGPKSHGRARSPECSPSRARGTVQASGWRRRLESGTFPPRKPLKTNETELESRQFLPVRKDADATSVSPYRKESRDTASFSASFAGSQRGGGCAAAKFSYPQPLEKARNCEGIWQAVAPRAAFGGRRVRLRRFHPSGSAGSRCELARTGEALDLVDPHLLVIGRRPRARCNGTARAQMNCFDSFSPCP